jgi:hypothetical protein
MNRLIDNDHPDNPFKASKYGNVQTYYMGSDDRIRHVKEFGLKECEVALRLRGLQKTVRRAIEIRVRKLIKAGA